MSVRQAIVPLLVLEKQNKKTGPLPLTSGSLNSILSTSMVGAPAPPAPPPPLKRKFIQTYFITLTNKEQRTSGGASSGTNPHELGTTGTAASSSSAGTGAGAGAGAGASARDAITL